MAYPTVAQITEFLEAQGLTAPADLDEFLASVIKEWELRTGYIPFLGEASETEWKFDVPVASDIVDFKGGFWAISEVLTGVYGTSVGTESVLNTGHLLLPNNAVLEGKPYTGMKLISGPMAGWTRGQSDFQSIVVTGKRGWPAIPDDVFQAIKERAAGDALAEIMQGTGSASEVKQGPVTIKYDTDENKSKVSLWSRGFDRAVSRYRRD
jgi:hypothetical protein